MATYILRASFTDQGIRKIKDSPKRADARFSKPCADGRSAIPEVSSPVWSCGGELSRRSRSLNRKPNRHSNARRQCFARSSSFLYIWNETLQCRLGRLFVVGFGWRRLWLFRWGRIDLRPRARTGGLGAYGRSLLTVSMGIVLAMPHEHYDRDDRRRHHKTYSGN